MRSRIGSVGVWIVVAFVVGLSIANVAHLLGDGEPGASFVAVFGQVLDILLPLVFAGTGAVILLRQPGNVIGWLLMAPSVFALDAIDLSTPPSSLSLIGWLTIWLSGWSWILLVFPVILLMALFPTGKSLTPRWRWIPWLVMGMSGFMVGWGTFIKWMGPLDATGDKPLWLVENPIGFITTDLLASGSPGATIWSILLATVTVGALASIIVRFRRADYLERQQVKWLLFAVSVFAAFYVPGALSEGWTAGGWLDAGFILALAFIPIAVAIAVLRYRVFDIDLVIRRTLAYAAVTAFLAGAFFGSVFLFQNVIEQVTRVDSALGVAASTLMIAALFNPLRRRVQTFVDHRFFRTRYDADRILTEFGEMTRSETDMDRLSEELLGVVSGALRPTSIGIWVNNGRTG